MMAIPIPVTQTKIATVPWGIPITNEVNRLTTVTTPSVWTNLTLINGWTPGSPPPAYRKIGDLVYVRGWSSGGAQWSAMYALPVGFRPPVDTVVNASVVIGGAWQPGSLQVIKSTGEIQMLTAGVQHCVAGFSFSITA